MKERPILFQGAMVRALLAGTKTQTRRIVKPQPDTRPGMNCTRLIFKDRKGAPLLDEALESPEPVLYRSLCPYGQPGDRLWVRETWGYRCSMSAPDDAWHHTIAYRADDARQTFGPMPMDGVSLPRQRAALPDEPWEAREAYLTAYWQQWKPSIHMPRWASRILLEITDVRVERLQDISELDAAAEGVVWEQGQKAAHVFETLWQSINGDGSWAANPWVWVVEFKRVKP